MLALERLTAAAPLLRMIPYHELVAVPVWASKVTGWAMVPLTLSVPLTVISTRVVSRPAAWPSVSATCTSRPALMVRNAPFTTVMSPRMMYGLPASVQVWLMMLPPLMIVALAGVVGSADSARAESAAMMARQKDR